MVTTSPAPLDELEGAQHLDRRRGRARGQALYESELPAAIAWFWVPKARACVDLRARALRPAGAHPYARERREPERFGASGVCLFESREGARRVASTAAISSIPTRVLDLLN